MPFHRTSFQILTILILILVIYAQSLSFAFVWDDQMHLAKDSQVFQESFPSELFFMSTWPGNLYRPVFSVSLWLNQKIFGIDAWGFHLVNLILHFCVSILTLVFVRQIFHNSLLAFTTALLFAVSPMYAEVVANISYRTESLSALFILICLIAAWRYLKDYSFQYLLAVGLTALLAMLSKESGVVICLLIPLLIWKSCSRSADTYWKKENFFLLFCPAIGLVIYIYLRQLSLDKLVAMQSTSQFSNVLIEADWIERVTRSLIFQGQYIFSLLAPRQNFQDFNLMNVSQNLKWDFVSIFYLILFVFSASLIVFIKKDTSTKFGLIWYLLSFAVTSNIFLTIGTHYANRLSYLPGLGIYLCLASVYCHFARSIASRLVILVYLILSIFIAIQQTAPWSTNWKISNYEYRLGTKSLIVLNSLGAMYHNLDQPKKAILKLQEAIALAHNFWPAHLQLCSILIEEKKFSLAQKHLTALKLYQPTALINYEIQGFIDLGQENYASAISNFELVLIDQPDSKAVLAGLKEARAKASHLQTDHP